jgi:branched-chain amino acid transport system ATP-binding protein
MCLLGRSVMACKDRSRSLSRWLARRVSYVSTSPGLSPAERGNLVAILNGLPRHIGYVIIEHDLDVALRVSEDVSMMHNGCVFKEGAPREIERDSEVQEIYLGGGLG